MKLNFVQKVVIESKGLTACIADIALTNNEIEQLFEIFHEQNIMNPDLLRKMMGENVYSDYLEVVKVD